VSVRPWPTPAPGEPDLIIRDADRFNILREFAASQLPGSSAAADLIREHHIAVAANLHIGAALQRYRNATVKES